MQLNKADFRFSHKKYPHIHIANFYEIQNLLLFFFFFFFFFFCIFMRANLLTCLLKYIINFKFNSSSCTTIELSKLLTSCLTAVKNHVIRYCEKVYERSGKNLFWSIKNSGEVLNKVERIPCDQFVNL